MSDRKRRNIRYRKRKRHLAKWDYSTPGAYFVTFCTHGRKEILGHVESGEMILSEAGAICNDIIRTQTSCTIDHFVIMPNHIHLLIRLSGGQSLPLSKILRSMKAAMSIECHARGIEGKIWQTSFHDHIVRNQKDHDQLYEYIENNPLRWESDCMNAKSISQAEACATKTVQANSVIPAYWQALSLCKKAHNQHTSDVLSSAIKVVAFDSIRYQLRQLPQFLRQLDKKISFWLNCVTMLHTLNRCIGRAAWRHRP